MSYERAIIASDWLQPYRHLTEHRIYFTAPHMNDYYETGASPSLVVSAILPVFAEGRRLGFVIGDIDYPMLSSVLDEIYRQNAINISMVSDTGLYVFHRDGRQVNAKVDPGLLSQMRGEEGEFPYASPSGRQLCVYQKSTVTGWYLLASIPYSSILRPSANVARIILFLIMPFSLCCAVGLTVLLSRRIRRPLARLVRRIEQVDIEHFEPMSLPDEVGEIANLRHKFEEMLQRINQLVVQSYRLEIQQRDAQFEALRSQITPHFMYNALQLIKTEAVVAGNNEISGIVTSFGNLLRYASETTPSLVSVEEELDYIRDCLAIYQRRFGRRFDYRIESDPKILRLAILKLVLQPLVENSIMHGLKEAKADGRIEIEARRDAECVSFSLWPITGAGSPRRSFEGSSRSWIRVHTRTAGSDCTTCTREPGSSMDQGTASLR